MCVTNAPAISLNSMEPFHLLCVPSKSSKKPAQMQVLILAYLGHMVYTFQYKNEMFLPVNTT